MILLGEAAGCKSISCHVQQCNSCLIKNKSLTLLASVSEEVSVRLA